MHGCTSVLSWCIDTLWCTVCGLSFGHLAAVREQAGESSELCRISLLLRGPFLTDEQHRCGLDEAQTTRKGNDRVGCSTHESDRLCVRTCGPHLPPIDRHGEEVIPSEKKVIRLGHTGPCIFQLTCLRLMTMTSRMDDAQLHGLQPVQYSVVCAEEKG